MKVVIVACLFAVVLCYDDIDDNYDYEHLKDNPEELEHFVNCFLDEEPCMNPVAKSIRPHVEEVFENKCLKCSDLQKRNGLLFLVAVKEVFPNKYEALKIKYGSEKVEGYTDVILLT